MTPDSRILSALRNLVTAMASDPEDLPAVEVALERAEAALSVVSLNARDWPVRMVTVDMRTEDLTTTSTTVMFNGHDNRVWASKHLYWAMQNQQSVTFTPLATEPSDV